MYVLFNSSNVTETLLSVGSFEVPFMEDSVWTDTCSIGLLIILFLYSYEITAGHHGKSSTFTQ